MLGVVFQRLALDFCSLVLVSQNVANETHGLSFAPFELLSGLALSF